MLLDGYFLDQVIGLAGSDAVGCGSNRFGVVTMAITFKTGKALVKNSSNCPKFHNMVSELLFL